MSANRFVCCLKYGKLYSAEYVNVLYNAVRKAMNGPFRFLCLTDCADGLTPGIEALPIPNLGLSPQDWFVGGVWPKLGIYDRYFHGLKGRMLFIDLDMMIISDLDSFFDLPGQFIGINAGPGWGSSNTDVKPELGSALVAFDIGSLGHLVEKFQNEKVEIMRRFRTEQAYTEFELDEINFWPEGWVISFKRSCRRPVLVDFFLEPKPPKPTAKVLAFHGTPRPIDLIGQGRNFFWGRFPHFGCGKVSWVVDYWYENGGRVLSDE